MNGVLFTSRSDVVTIAVGFSPRSGASEGLRRIETQPSLGDSHSSAAGQPFNAQTNSPP